MVPHSLNKRIYCLYLRCECWLQNKPFLFEKCTHTSRRSCQFSNRKIAWKCAVTSQDYKNQGILHQLPIKSTDDEWYKSRIISIVRQVKVVNWYESFFCAFRCCVYLQRNMHNYFHSWVSWNATHFPVHSYSSFVSRILLTCIILLN